MLLVFNALESTPPASFMRPHAMTIVSSRLCISDLHDSDLVRTFAGDARSALLGAFAATDLQRRALFLFDCVSRLTGADHGRSVLAFQSNSFVSMQHVFFGALFSTNFVKYSDLVRSNLAIAFRAGLTQLSARTKVTFCDFVPKEGQRPPVEWTARFDALKLDEREVKRLSGHYLIANDDAPYRINLDGVTKTLGPEFADQLCEGLAQIARTKAKDTALRDFANTLGRFLERCDHETALEMTRPQCSPVFLKGFMDFHFEKSLKGPPKEGRLSSLQKLWTRYVGYWQRLAADGYIATSFVYPAGNPSLSTVTTIRHQRGDPSSSDECAFTQKLLTPVPLRVSNHCALEIICHDIKHDFDRTAAWLGSQVNSFVTDYHKGVSMRTNGLRLDVDKFDARLLRPDSSTLAVPTALRLLHEHYQGYVDTTSTRCLLYPHGKSSGFVSKALLSRYAGIPSRTDALLFAALLMSYDARLTESALLTANIFAKSGRRIAAPDNDAGIVLAVPKDRARHFDYVPFSGEAERLLRVWLTATEPIRNYMKRVEIAGWQRLFVYASTPLGKPASFAKAFSSYTAMREICSKHADALGHLAETITLSRIRSTKGVLIFLDKLDLAEMARALGNTQGVALKHYLPPAIYEFFLDRWVRIFQNVLIISAVSDPLRRLEASDFATMEELDEFLANHAVATAPFVDQPTAATSQPLDGEGPTLFIVAAPSIFAALLSIRRAVETATGAVAVEATYWAEFARRLEKHIDSDQYTDTEVRLILATARKSIDPSPFYRVVRNV